MNTRPGTWLTIVASTLIVVACSRFRESELLGRWQAVSIEEEGEALPGVDPAEIHFTFQRPNGYEYQGNLKYQEAGTFSVNNELLLTMDTINQASSEKAVEIIKLSRDSLFLRMQDNGRERIMRLHRIE